MEVEGVEAPRQRGEGGTEQEHGPFVARHLDAQRPGRRLVRARRSAQHGRAGRRAGHRQRRVAVGWSDSDTRPPAARWRLAPAGETGTCRPPWRAAVLLGRGLRALPAPCERPRRAPERPGERKSGQRLLHQSVAPLGGPRPEGRGARRRYAGAMTSGAPDPRDVAPPMLGRAVDASKFNLAAAEQAALDLLRGRRVDLGRIDRAFSSSPPTLITAAPPDGRSRSSSPGVAAASVPRWPG